jgi:hypothetical protein
MPELLAAIESAWTLKPDLRLGQVLNLACLAIGERLAMGPFVLFEEDQILTGIRCLEREWQNHPQACPQPGLRPKRWCAAGRIKLWQSVA